MGECAADKIRGGARSNVGVGAGSSIMFNVRSMRPSSSPPSSHLDNQNTQVSSFLPQPSQSVYIDISKVFLYQHSCTFYYMCGYMCECK